MSISDRIVVMKAGRIVEDGPPLELYLRPKTIFTANFLGEANFLEGKMVERTQTGSLVQVGETYLRTTDQTRKVGEEVIVAVRPEFLYVVRNAGDQSSLKGRISEIRFVGYMTRYEIEISGRRTLSVERPICFGELDLEPQDEVAVAASPHHIMIYPLPQEGLERELQLE
jgi:ABC-type Fe3+/spermidine/putrescine transport system ATPase subunit